jgi:hypothetical protein
MPANEDIQDLPKIFELAIPHWCEYFNVAPEKMAAWKVSVCLIQDRKKFAAAAGPSICIGNGCIAGLIRSPGLTTTADGGGVCC